MRMFIVLALSDGLKNQTVQITDHEERDIYIAKMNKSNVWIFDQKSKDRNVKSSG